MKQYPILKRNFNLKQAPIYIQQNYKKHLINYQQFTCHSNRINYNLTQDIGLNIETLKLYHQTKRQGFREYQIEQTRKRLFNNQRNFYEFYHIERELDKMSLNQSFDQENLDIICPQFIEYNYDNRDERPAQDLVQDALDLLNTHGIIIKEYFSTNSSMNQGEYLNQSFQDNFDFLPENQEQNTKECQSHQQMQIQQPRQRPLSQFQYNHLVLSSSEIRKRFQQQAYKEIRLILLSNLLEQMIDYLDPKSYGKGLNYRNRQRFWVLLDITRKAGEITGQILSMLVNFANTYNDSTIDKQQFYQFESIHIMRTILQMQQDTKQKEQEQQIIKRSLDRFIRYYKT